MIYGHVRRRYKPPQSSPPKNGQVIGGETVVMAFVFTKSLVDIVLLPKREYRVRVQKFSDGSPTGMVQEQVFVTSVLDGDAN